MSIQPGAPPHSGARNGWQWAAVSFPFLLPFILLAGQHSLAGWPGWLYTGLVLAGGQGVAGLCVLGVLRGYPLWALPSLGMLLFFISAGIHLAIRAITSFLVMLPGFGNRVAAYGLVFDIGRALAEQALLAFLLVLLILIFLCLAPGLQAQVRQDWTSLPFLIYGMAILPMLGNDEFTGIERYQVACLLLLAAGAGIYLVAPQRWQRFIALFVPVLLAPGLMSAGLYLAFPFQAWADPGKLTFRLWEALQPTLDLAPLPAILLLTACVNRIPMVGRRDASTTDSTAQHLL